MTESRVAAQQSKTALVLSGGGIMGAAYEIGALCALDRLFSPGFSTRRFHTYVGVSAGSVVATLIANRVSPAGLYQSIANDESNVFNFKRSDIYRIKWWEIFASMGHTAQNLFNIYRHYRRSRWSLSSGDFLHILQEQMPAGIFSLEPLRAYLCEAFRNEGIRDDFDSLPSKLYIPAIDLDSGSRVIFGDEGQRQVHICQAITASCAIPVFFRPYRIGSHAYIDGGLGHPAHIDIAIDKGAKLILVINPRVPINNNFEHSCLPSSSYGRCASIADLGIALAWEQAQRVEHRNKLSIALDAYRHKHPDVDIVLIEPSVDEPLLFFQNPMSFQARIHVMNYGYQLSMGQIRARYPELQAVFARHGIKTTEARLFAGPPGS